MDWPRTRFGQRLLAEEQPRLDELVRRLHGDFLVWAGPVPCATQGLKRCMVRKSLYLSHPGEAANFDMACFVARLCALPLPSKSVDNLVLHHSLEREEDPRQALREVGRVIAPGGRLILCGFNRFSAWGLRQLYSRIRPDLFSGWRFVNPLRLFDWLALLGFELDEPPAYLGFGAPLNLGGQAASKPSAWLGRALPPLGAVLVLSAIKQAHGLRTPPPQPLPHRKLATA